MSLKLIKEAQARLKLGNQVSVAEQVQKILGVSSLYEVSSKLFNENFDSSQFEVTPEDYTNWLQTLISVAKDDGINLNVKRDFMDLLHDQILDNDPKLDALGNRQETSERIASALWQAYKVNQAHGKVQDHVNQTITSGRQEEEAVASMMGSKSMGAEDEEDGGGFSQGMQTAVGMEDEQRTNPHRPGTLRHALWNDVNKKSAREEEEFHDFEEEPSAEDLAASIVGDGGRGQGEIEADDNEFGRVDDVEDHPEDLEARLNDLEARLNHVEDEVDGGAGAEVEPEEDDDIDYDGLGTDRGGAAQVIGVSVPASGKVDPRMDGEEPEFEDEETKTKNMFRQAVTAPREHMSQVIKDIENEGTKAWGEMKLPKNPHPKKSQAHRAWTKGLTAAAKEALGIKDKPAVPAKARKK